MVVWKEEYSLGIPHIDEQHRKLFDIANDIYALVANQLVTDKYDQIINIINELKDYTVDHFAAEELYMKEKGFRRLLSHKVAHQDFIAKMNEIDLGALDESQEEHLREILQFVTDWLVQHILVEDKQYVQ